MGLSNAARMFTQLYGVEIARRNGINVTHEEFSELATSASSLSGYNKLAADVSDFGSKLNKGMMAEMQANPTDTENDCFTTTSANNLLILDMFDFTAYTTASFDFGIFLEKTQIMNLKFMEQLDKCGYNKYLIALDEMTNNLPMLVSSGANLVTQVGTGFSNQDTSIFLSIDKFEACFKDGLKVESCGGGLQLGLSQLLKITAEDASVDVVPTNAM